MMSVVRSPYPDSRSRIHKNPFAAFLSIAFLAVFLMLPNAVCAEPATLHGVVYDSSSAELLPAANLVLTSGRFETGTLTTLDGAFEFSNLKPGNYRLIVTFVGYSDKMIEDCSLISGETRSLKIHLAPKNILLNPMTVSASRRRERVIEAPAEVRVVETQDIEARPTLSPAEHLRGIQSVDLATTGLSSGRIVVRGFNSTFSGRLLTLTDNRISNIPGLRVNALQWIPVTNDDIERMEVIEGPASALYGPNAAGGVLHIVTKSPFDSKGTRVSLGVGERNLRITSFRHAGVINNKVGYKLSLKYQQGTEWPFTDSAEPDSVIKGYQIGLDRTEVGNRVSNQRQPDMQEFSADARVDYQISPEATAVISGGLARVTDVEITGIGSYQVENWAVGYIQGRMIYKDLFAQIFMNTNDSGDGTYNLRNGNFATDKSRVFVAQLQHGLTLFENRQAFTYGADLIRTRPESEGTIYGLNEDHTDLNQFGYYLQTKTSLASNLNFIAAGRVDHQNTLEMMAFSPRAALVFKPKNDQSIRITFNQAFQMPEVLQQFIDHNISATLSGLPYPIQLMGNPPKTGWTYRRDENGGLDGLYMQSPFTPPQYGGITQDLPAEATQMWPAMVAIMQSKRVDISKLPAPGSSNVGTELKMLNLTTGDFEHVGPDKVVHTPALKPRKTRTYEVGYKGILSHKVYATANLYYEQNRNFSGQIVSANVFYNSGDLAAHLSQFMPAENAVSIAEGIARIPVGTVTAQGAHPAALMVSFRTQENRTLSHYGLELGLKYYAGRHWTLSGNYTYRTPNYFKSNLPDFDDVSLNAPKHKVGAALKFKHDELGLDGKLRVRLQSKVNILGSSLGSGILSRYTILDLNGGLKLPFDRRFKISVSIQNLLNNKHQEVFGAPEIGRLAITRLQFSL